MNRIASVQMNCKNVKLDENLSKILGCIDEACDHGADLICSPAGWVMNDTKEKIMKNPGNYNMPLENALCISASKCNSLYIAAAARVGEERGTKWTGYSLITAPSGEVLSSADGEHEKILYADVDLRRAKEYRQSGNRNNLFSDRRTDFYDEMLGLDAKRYIQ